MTKSIVTTPLIKNMDLSKLNISGKKQLGNLRLSISSIPEKLNLDQEIPGENIAPLNLSELNYSDYRKAGIRIAARTAETAFLLPVKHFLGGATQSLLQR